MSEDEQSDDDWFETAFEEDEPDDADNESDDIAEQSQERSPVEDATGTDSETGTPSDSPFDDESAGDEASGSPFDSDDSGFDNDGDSSSFEDDAEDQSFDTDTPFDDSGSTFEDDSGSLFDDDFANAMASTGPGDGGGGGSSEEFDDTDFESEIPRIDLGIDGLDRMIKGGIPERHLMVSIGAPGAGKTTFGLQFLYHGLQQGDNAVFITLEQTREAIQDTANERGWEFDRYEEENMLAIVDLDPVEMANSLDNIRGELPQLVRDFDAERLVLDSVSLLEMMYDDQAKRRTEVFDFTRSLKEAGVTTMLTSEASENNPYASRHGIIEYLTDAVFVLQYVRGDTQEARLAVEIQKIRNADHSRQTKPYEITLDGIDVYQQASIF